MEAQQPNRESLLHEYEVGTLLYIYDDELRWSRFTTLTAMHGAVLVGWLSIMNDFNNFLFRALPLFGLVLSWMMFANLQRATAHFAYRDGRLKWIEEQLAKNGSPDEFRSYSDRHPVTDFMLYGRLRKYSRVRAKGLYATLTLPSYSGCLAFFPCCEQSINI